MAAEIDQQIEVLRWYKQLKETNNEIFLPLFFDEHRYLVLKGGGGSGKSIFAGRKVLERCATEPGHRFLVCRKVAKTLRESCFEQLKGQAYDFYSDKVDYIPRGKGGDMYIRFKNGSEILFAGLDDVEKLKSIFNITGIWIEEASELAEGDFNQLDIRLRTESKYYLQIILSFNPISIMHWLKKRFFDFDIKDPAEREKAVARTITCESTYHDNRFLIPEAIQTLEAFKFTDPYYYQVYCLGQWGVTGKTVFPQELVAAQLAKNIQPVRVGEFAYSYDGMRLTEQQLIDSETGFIQIFEEPQKGRPYVIGGDTAGEGSDWFIGWVIDNASGRQVALLRHQMDEDLYARQMVCLGNYYNEAMIGVECNYSTFPQKEMERLGYKNFYVREQEDQYTHAAVKAFGFKTTSLTRPIIIAGLIQLMREHPELVQDRATLEEMLTFVRNEKGRAEAEIGAHDDCVMAAAICYYIRTQQRMSVEEEATAKKKWTHDMWEDYYNSTAEMKEYLLRKWGEPET